MIKNYLYFVVWNCDKSRKITILKMVKKQMINNYLILILITLAIGYVSLV